MIIKQESNQLWQLSSTWIGCRLWEENQEPTCAGAAARTAALENDWLKSETAQSGDCVLPPAGARRYEANYRGIEGEHWAQCARVRRQREEHTLVKRQSWGPSNNGGLRMVIWESQSKTTPQSPEDGIYYILLIRIAFCHVSANLPLRCLFYVTTKIYFCFLC